MAGMLRTLDCHHTNHGLSTEYSHIASKSCYHPGTRESSDGKEHALPNAACDNETSIPRGQTSVLHENIYLGTLPRRLVLCFVDDMAMAGSYQQNPFNFQHFGINHLALYVNGEMIPHQPYQPNFATGRYLRDYLSIFQGTDTKFSSEL